MCLKVCEQFSLRRLQRGCSFSPFYRADLSQLMRESCYQTIAFEHDSTGWLKVANFGGCLSQRCCSATPCSWFGGIWTCQQTLLCESIHRNVEQSVRPQIPYRSWCEMVEIKYIKRKLKTSHRNNFNNAQVIPWHRLSRRSGSTELAPS